MSFHPLNHNYFTANPIILPDPFSVINKPKIDIGSNRNSLKQYSADKFNFQTSKAFINHENQWLNSFKKNDIQLTNSSTVEKPKTSSLADQRKNYLQNNALLEENLAKTVKHTNFTYKKPSAQVNPESFKQIPFPFSQLKSSQQSNLPPQTDRIKQSKNCILSIDQIRQIQKKQLNDKIVHKITSSSSRQKLKTSSSKDSKGSVNVQKKSLNLNSNSQRYNKYINDGLININIDLRKQIAQNVVVPNLNVRKFGQSLGHFNQSVPNHQRIGSGLTQISKQNKEIVEILPQKNLINDCIKQSQHPPQTSRQSFPNQDHNFLIKFKNRSKSNLSKYSQLRQSARKDTFTLNPCQNQTSEKQQQNIQISKYQTPQKSQEPCIQQTKPKTQKKIHALSYSSTKNQSQKNNERGKFYQKLQLSCHVNQKPKQNMQRQSQNVIRESKGISINQSKRLQGSQTERKMIIRKDESQPFYMSSEQKIIKKPIRLTLQKRN